MTTAENETIARALRFAERVCAELPSVADGLPAPTRPLAEKVLDTATALRDRVGGRISVAAIGTAGAGTSGLLSALAGQPYPNPVVDTVIVHRHTRARDGASGAHTRTSAVVLSEVEVAALVEHLLERLVNLVDDSGRTHPVDALADSSPLRDGWGAFEHFGSRAWADPSLDPRVRAALTELAGVRDAVAIGRGLFGAGTARPAAILDESALAAAADPRRIPRAYPGARALLALRPGAVLDAETFTRIRPIVARVVLEISLQERSWPLGDLPPRTVLDFVDVPTPSDDWWGRVAYLAHRETGAADALLLVASADDPAVDLPGTIGTPGSPDETVRKPGRPAVVVVTNFDLAPLRSADDVAAAGTPLAERAVELRPDHRPAATVYTSALPFDVTAAARTHWGEVAEKLDTAGADAATVRALRDFAADNGVGGLRRTITDEIVGRCVATLTSEVDDLVGRLRLDLAALLTDVEARDPATAESRLGRLTAEASAAVRIVRAEIRDASRNRHSAGPGGRDPATVLRDLVAVEVASWDEWGRLFRALDADFTIARSQPEEKPSAHIWSAATAPPGQFPFPLAEDDELDAEFLYGGGSDSQNDTASVSDLEPVIDTTTALTGPFARVVRLVDAEVARLLREGTVSWTQRVRVRSTALADLLADRSTLEALSKSVDGNPRKARIRHAYLTDLSRLGFVDYQLDQVLAGLANTDPVAVFPLKVDRALPWHGGALSTAVHLRHLSVVLRMRRDIVRTIVEQARSRLATAQLQLVDGLESSLSKIEAALPPRALRQRQPHTRTELARVVAVLTDLLAHGADEVDS